VRKKTRKLGKKKNGLSSEVGVGGQRSEHKDPGSDLPPIFQCGSRAKIRAVVLDWQGEPCF